MEGYFSIGQMPQRAVLPMEEGRSRVKGRKQRKIGINITWNLCLGTNGAT